MPDYNNKLQGVALAASSYILWGILPIYWKLLQHVSALQVLCHRIAWCFVFLLLLIFLSGRWPSFKSEIAAIYHQPRKVLGIILAAVMINLNWGIYIWAIINSHVIETSLGYYINPLVSVILGVMVLKEKMDKWQYAAFILALLAVLNLTIQIGSLPWISVSLAITFALYGLLKKMVGIGAITGLTLETLIMMVPVMLYLYQVQQTGNGAFEIGSPVTSALLIGAGVVTAVPLLLFASGTLRLSLTIIGFLQYISPTLTLLLGIFIYHEAFTRAHQVSFIMIWIGLIIFMVSQIKLLRKDSDKTGHSYLS